ncbi:tyrosine--tRNA ligase [Candidatus Giovannonibacteria bacterium]|nr:tyrosine--tRNA ligase [Candidatus Giovannonibacteria bacterium]
MVKVLEKEIKEILNRNVETVIEKGSLLKKLLSGKRLRIKLGIDPTGKKIHIGRAVLLNKLKDFQDLGHRVVLIIGDFTAEIGDPSDKLEKRPMLTKKDVQANLKNYLSQVGKIIDLKKAEIHYNSKWLSKLSFAEITKIAEIFTVQQMLERRNFKERFTAHKEISLRELFYPIMQGYDSVIVKADLEMGGTDQLFNLLAGRKIQEFYGKPPQEILIIQMLEGTDGRKMSTSWGNVINIIDEPNDMFGKVMSIRDSLVEKYFFLATRMDEKNIKSALAMPAIEAKEGLAYEIVKIYHGDAAANKARQFFKETFRQKKLPEEVDEIKFNRAQKLSEVLIGAGLVSSGSEFRRLLRQGAIEFDNKIVRDPNFKLEASGFLKVGKKIFAKLLPK